MEILGRTEMLLDSQLGQESFETLAGELWAWIADDPFKRSKLLENLLECGYNGRRSWSLEHLDYGKS
jgi:hypothetical protein